MNIRREHIFFASVTAALLICLAILSSHGSPAFAQSISPTPTYDPLEQPPLPPNPTEYELGRYLYWQHCMPCHGDRGQGLTDEFRGVWVEDHQDCWSRGCHSGKYANDSFYIPTIVPALVKSDDLAYFASQQELFDYLKTTHPPQDPGFLEEDEYRALALFVFSMNDRLTASPMPSPSVTPTPSLPPSSRLNQLPSFVPLILIGFILVFIMVILHKRTNVRAPEK